MKLEVKGPNSTGSKSKFWIGVMWNVVTGQLI